MHRPVCVVEQCFPLRVVHKVFAVLPWRLVLQRPEPRLLAKWRLWIRSGCNSGAAGSSGCVGGSGRTGQQNRPSPSMNLAAWSHRLLGRHGAAFLSSSIIVMMLMPNTAAGRGSIDQPM